MAGAQTWTVIGLLGAALFALLVQLRGLDYRLSDRLSDGFARMDRQFGELRGEFGELRGQFGELRGEFAQLRADVHGELAELRAELRLHDHRPD